MSTERNPITRALGRREMLAVAAAFTLLLLAFNALRAPEPAGAQASNDKKNDAESLVATGDEIEGKTETKGDASRGPAAMPKTGSELEQPILFGLVLLLDGALAFLVSSRRRLQAPSTT